MANTVRTRGFMPRRHTNGSPYNGACTPYLVTEATATFIGDVMMDTGTSGAAGVIVSGIDCEGMTIAGHSTNTNTGAGVLGVCVGFVPVTTLPGNYRAASVSQVVLVCTDPTVVYEVQEDAAGTPIAAADIGSNISMLSGAGSTVTGASAYTIDSDDTSTSSAYPWKLLGLVKRPDNALNTAGAGTDNAKFEVVLNSGRFLGQTVGQ